MSATSQAKAACAVPRNIRWEWDYDYYWSRHRLTIFGELNGNTFYISRWITDLDLSSCRNGPQAFINSAVNYFFDTAEKLSVTEKPDGAVLH